MQGERLRAGGFELYEGGRFILVNGWIRQIENGTAHILGKGFDTEWQCLGGAGCTPCMKHEDGIYEIWVKEEAERVWDPWLGRRLGFVRHRLRLLRRFTEASKRRVKGLICVKHHTLDCRECNRVRGKPLTERDLDGR